jgi:fido (protein-threonine AMPylation protein)
MVMQFEYPIGATPIDVDEAVGLIPTHICTQADLNAWEELNIIEGANWIFRQKILQKLDEGLVRELHRRMFTMPIDEIVVRFHHQLVLIHAFPNGNGRHARLIADALIINLGGEKFSWGSNSSNTTPSLTRQRYLLALRAADNHDVVPLLEFARA